MDLLCQNLELVLVLLVLLLQQLRLFLEDYLLLPCGVVRVVQLLDCFLVGLHPLLEVSVLLFDLLEAG